jgi:hypothetical protein
MLYLLQVHPDSMHIQLNTPGKWKFSPMIVGFIDREGGELALLIDRQA